MPRHLVVAAPNALYFQANLSQNVVGGAMRDFLFVGRLIESKKPSLLIDAFSLVAHELPPKTRLVFVGDGPLRQGLAAAAGRSAVPERIAFTGEITAPAELRALYADSLASVIPGYAGLSLIQSLGFGVPALIARDEPHSPEIEAAAPGENAVFFQSDSSQALGAALVETAADRSTWIRRREAIARRCARDYSVEAMVDRVAAVVDAVLARAPARTRRVER